MDNYIIYIHKNKINHKVYIGQTGQTNLQRRFRGGAGYRSSPHFYYAIQQYGWDNFEHEILEQNLSADEADERERFWIKLFNATDPDYGYNLTNGGKTKPLDCKQPNRCKKVICKETGQVFNSLTEAALWSGMKATSTSNITAQIQGKKPTAGKHPETGESLHWCYTQDDINLPNMEKIKPGAKRVKNLDTEDEFVSVNEAAKAYGVSNVTISKSCHSNGQIAVGANGGPKYHWIFMN